MAVMMMMMMTTANNNNNDDGDLLAMTRPSRWRARLRVKQPSDRVTTTFWASCHTLPGGSGWLCCLGAMRIGAVAHAVFVHRKL